MGMIFPEASLTASGIPPRASFADAEFGYNLTMLASTHFLVNKLILTAAKLYSLVLSTFNKLLYRGK